LFGIPHCANAVPYRANSRHAKPLVEHNDLVIENFVNGIANNHLQIGGCELILGKTYVGTGFPVGGHATIFAIGFYAGWFTMGVC